MEKDKENDTEALTIQALAIAFDIGLRNMGVAVVSHEITPFTSPNGLFQQQFVIPFVGCIDIKPPAEETKRPKTLDYIANIPGFLDKVVRDFSIGPETQVVIENQTAKEMCSIAYAIASYFLYRVGTPKKKIRVTSASLKFGFAKYGSPKPAKPTLVTASNQGKCYRLNKKFIVDTVVYLLEQGAVVFASDVPGEVWSNAKKKDDIADAIGLAVIVLLARNKK
jgi:hypothetical protein